MTNKTVIVSIDGNHFIRRFRNLKIAHAYMLWYCDRIQAHYSYKILSATGRILEEDTL